MTFVPDEAISSISSYDISGSLRAFETMRGSAQSYEFPRALLLAGVDLGLLARLIWLLLYLQSTQARFNQTLSAMAGTGSIMGLVALPLLVMASPETVSGPVPASLVSVWLLLLLWNLFVMAHIIRHALSTTFLVGVGFSILYAVISMQVITTLFP